jgi:hypothetical protein
MPADARLCEGHEQHASLRPFAPLKARHPQSQAAPAASATILKQGGL